MTFSTSIYALKVRVSTSYLLLSKKKKVCWIEIREPASAGTNLLSQIAFKEIHEQGHIWRNLRDFEGREYKIFPLASSIFCEQSDWKNNAVDYTFEYWKWVKISPILPPSVADSQTEANFLTFAGAFPPVTSPLHTGEEIDDQ